jgi:signal transduction histidine kinase
MSGDPLIPGAHPYGRRADDLPEHQQRVLDRRVAAVVERMSDAFLALGPDWRVTYANAEAARLNGTTPGALVGRDHWAAWPETVGSEVERQYRRAAAERLPVTFEHHYAKAGVWHDIRAYPADDGGLAVFYRDITPQKRQAIEREHLLAEARLAYAEADRERAAAERAREEAEEANAAKAQFLATMSHELRTPLTAIGGYAQLLELGVFGAVAPEQQEVLARIQRSQHHVLGLLNAVLRFAKLEAGRVHFEVGDTPLGEVFTTVAALIEPQARAKGLALAIEAPAPELVAVADAEKVRQILVNLLSNAVKFTAAGMVRLSAAALSAEALAVRVEDTGRGIGAAHRDRVFEPFVQEARRPSAGAPAGEEGVGLGLAISRELARAMGGDLTVESEVGVGSTFTLTLPRARA